MIFEEMRLAPLGEGAVVATLGDAVDPVLNDRVRRLADRLRQARLSYVVDVVPAYAALTVFYDPLLAGYDTVAARLTALAATAERESEAPPPREVRIPVRYDGPDLAYVADRTGLTVEEVVARHSAPWYRVYLMGFVPGFAYLGKLDPVLTVPRREKPRTRVPAGSVAIGGAQTAVYPLETPGGWHLIGRADAVLFDPLRSPPALLAVGDRVRFDPL